MPSKMIREIQINIPILYSGRPGAGKSKKTKENVFQIQGCHLYVVPTIPLAEEVRDDLHRLRSHYPNTRCHIYSINSEDKAKGGGNTFARIEDEAAKHPPDVDHCVIVIAQASFIELDLNKFRGWHLHIDEVLANAVASGALHFPVMWRGLESLFRLERIADDDEKAILVAQEGVEFKDVRADPAIGDDVANLFKRCGGGRRIRGPKDVLREQTRVAQTPVIIECTDLAEIGERRVSWYSSWSLRQACEYFASIEIAASDFEQSMTYLGDADPVVLDRQPIPFGVSQAKIHIRYFSAGDRCTSNYWISPEGRANLKLVGEFLREQKVGFWSTNATAKDFLCGLIGEQSYVAPRCEGVNHLWDKRSCAAIFSMKGQAHEEVLSKINPALDRDRITELREGSALWQFVMRGAPRNGDYKADYTVFVYDHVQAEEIKKKFRENRLPVVDVDHVRLPGFVDRRRAKRGPKAEALTVQERQEKIRAGNRERQSEFRRRRKNVVKIK